MPYFNKNKLFSFIKSTIILNSNDKAINLIQKADLNEKSIYKKLI